VQVAVTALGHASVLIEAPGQRIVCDPVLGAGLGPGLGRLRFVPGRMRPPVLTAEELGPVDAVLLSHSHWDHTCTPTLRKIARRSPGATAIVHRGNTDLARRRFREVREMRWGEVTDLAPAADGARIRVTSVRSRHWGARVVVDRWRGWGGYLLEWPEIPSPADPARPLSVLFAGDTAETDAYAELREARGGAGVDLALMPIGAYDPWIWNHCTPEQAWRMAVEDLGAVRVAPMHYDTFRLSNEPEGEPLRRFRAAAADAGAPERLVGAPYGARVVLGRDGIETPPAP
jgi:L-ascorbate metabolism protein UlaG (beta-lactamase superfamily)